MNQNRRLDVQNTKYTDRRQEVYTARLIFLIDSLEF